MIPVDKSVRSSVGQKYLMSVTGLALVIFIILHLAGNLALLSSDKTALNAYAAKLHSFGNLTIAAEIGLAIVILFHFALAFKLTLNYRGARDTKYRMVRSKNEATSNVASRNMIISGVVLFAFMVFHVWQFRFGPGEAAGYTANIHGESVRDLYRLAVEVFKQPLYVAIYTVVMIFLGAHLRHGFWSAFQSLGAMNPRFSKPVYAVALAIAIILSVGFISLPLYIYFH